MLITYLTIDKWNKALKYQDNSLYFALFCTWINICQETLCCRSHSYTNIKVKKRIPDLNACKKVFVQTSYSYLFMTWGGSSSSFNTPFICSVGLGCSSACGPGCQENIGKGLRLDNQKNSQRKHNTSYIVWL